MNKFETKKISKSELLILNEDDLMFITNPGRMGDEDGSTFIIKQDKELNIYRVENWMYPKEGEKEEFSWDDLLKHFPKWHDAWKHCNEKEYKSKYKYLYMGFGNGLSVDNSIYNEFEPYLNRLVEDYTSKKCEDTDSHKYAAIYNVWKQAVISMAEDKGYVLK